MYVLASPDTGVLGIVTTENVVVQQFCANDLRLFQLCSATDAPVPKAPTHVNEHQRRLTGIDDIVLSLTA
jgi:inosine-uridine nucleoside N-ribohydrolase